VLICQVETTVLSPPSLFKSSKSPDWKHVNTTIFHIKQELIFLYILAISVLIQCINDRSYDPMSLHHIHINTNEGGDNTVVSTWHISTVVMSVTNSTQKLYSVLYLCFLAYSGVQHLLCYVYVSFFLVLCTLCCQFLWIVHFWLPLRI
jgi:hypothetical protein